MGWRYTINAYNTGNTEDGDAVGVTLCAVVRGTAKLSVAPCFIPKFFSGPFWVVLYDESEGYALISGGQPTIETDDGCQTEVGLWIFSHSSVRDETLIGTVRNMTEALGYDLSVLNDVDHTDCTYPDDEMTVFTE